jgi:hypothetical protein
MSKVVTDELLPAEDAFQVTLLASAEAIKNVLIDRNKWAEGVIGKRRRNLLKSLDSIIEAINHTYKGKLPENFVKRAETYYITTETAMTTLLKGYKAT